MITVQSDSMPAGAKFIQIYSQAMLQWSYVSYDAFQSLKSRIEASTVQMATQVVLMERAAR
ncbi:MAG: hypothetical protein P4M09_12795 [Devosia sp.]|nr:hypothetical protein [Devosia sp.]